MSLQYAGELIAAFIKRAGGSVKGRISTGTVPEGLKPVWPAAVEAHTCMSALLPKADMNQHGCDVRFVPKADIGAQNWLSQFSSN